MHLLSLDRLKIYFKEQKSFCKLNSLHGIVIISCRKIHRCTWVRMHLILKIVISKKYLKKLFLEPKMIKYYTRVKKIRHEITFIASSVKEAGLDVLYYSYAIFIIFCLFCPKVNMTHFFAKHLCTSTILDHLWFPKRFEIF
jgi:hypothetical protein